MEKLEIKSFQRDVAHNSGVDIEGIKNIISLEWEANPDKLYATEVKNLDNNIVHSFIVNIKESKIGHETIHNAPKLNAGRYEATLYEQKHRLSGNMMPIGHYNLIPLDTFYFRFRNVNARGRSQSPLRPLTEQEKKFCSCVKQVAAKESDGPCLTKKQYGKKGCYNPYAVCAKSVGTTTRRCGEVENYKKMNFSELRAIAKLKNIPGVNRMSRRQLINVLNA